MKYIIAILFVMGSWQIHAQPTAFGVDIQSNELKLEEVKDNKIFKGKMTAVTVKPYKDTMYFHVKGNNIFNPVVISLHEKNSKNKIAVSMHRDFWSDTEWQGTTDKDGNIVYSFKTGGDFGLRIVAPKNEKYELCVWIGEDVIPNIQLPFKKYSK